MEGESNNISDSRLMKGVLDELNGQCTKSKFQYCLRGNNEFKHLFHKVLTPSDVENKKFVIPRRYAIKYFSHIHHNEEIDIYDSSTQLWRFRFFYCQSSKKFSFTKGWPKFVMVKGLRARDIIVFNLCESKNGTNETLNTFVIDVVKSNEGLKLDLALNNNAIDADAALTPVLLFGKQIVVIVKSSTCYIFKITNLALLLKLNLATSIHNDVSVFQKRLYYEVEDTLLIPKLLTLFQTITLS
uniref:TF-B3 domain-containing protein n=1 Tax=Solanum lycopersicum TaxID=4081 RepID=A0A3Q7JV56_SOLLC